MMLREIVLIDEEKCDGCGLCVPACHEGAIRIIRGKAKLLADNLCDGLGACLGHCPQDAIRIEKRDAPDFDEAAVKAHLSNPARSLSRSAPGLSEPTPVRSEPAAVNRMNPGFSEPGSVNPVNLGQGSTLKPVNLGLAATPPHPGAHAGGCPSQRFARLGNPSARSLSEPTPALSERTPPLSERTPSLSEGTPPLSDRTLPLSEPGSVNPVNPASGTTPPEVSELMQWPVQFRLLPPRAPIFQGADLLLAADCVPFALPDFHRTLLRGRTVAIACPKLDDCSTYVPKLTEIIAGNSLHSITVVHMEVPCCTGILMMALQARANSGVDVPVEEVVVSVRGEILHRRHIPLDRERV